MSYSFYFVNWTLSVNKIKQYLVASKTFIRRFDASILCPFMASIALNASDAFEYLMYATP